MVKHLGVLLAVVWLGAGCTDSGLPDVGPGLAATFACPCPDGYDCDPVAKVCVAKGSALDGGSDSDAGSDSDVHEGVSDGSVADSPLSEVTLDQAALDAEAPEVILDSGDEVLDSGEVISDADTVIADSDEVNSDISEVTSGTAEVNSDLPDLPADLAQVDSDPDLTDADAAGEDLAAPDAVSDAEPDNTTPDDVPTPDSDASADLPPTCDGASPDSDSDGSPDCAELAAGCPEGALTDPSIAPGADELCDGKDNDCDGDTDEAADLTVPSGTCSAPGVCASPQTVATCAAGQWSCSYAAVPGYEFPAEASCDGVDNDCDGQTDEEFVYSQQGGTKPLVGQPCDGIGACGIGKVECAPGKVGLANCSSDPNGSKPANVTEICNDLDDDCDGQTDEGCDGDKDQYCTAAMVIVGTPKVCPKGGGDCADALPAIHPGAAELCDGLDNDCSGKTDEIFQYAEPSQVALSIGVLCGLGVCGAAKTVVTCASDQKSAICPGYIPQPESCDGKDNDCDGVTDPGCNDPEMCNGLDDNKNGQTDEGCDDDQDGYCDAALIIVGAPAVCPKGGGDCNDAVAPVNPGATELCDDVDNNCSNFTDEGCDDDKDGYCDAALPVVGKPAICSKTTAVGGKGDDCNDSPSGGALVNPGKPEVCDTVDNNCNAQADEENAINCASYYIDGDADGYGSGTAKCLCTADSGSGYVATLAGDCNDKDKLINPKATELCSTPSVDESCDGNLNNENAFGCATFYLDADGDTYGSATSKCLCIADTTTKYTAKVSGDCNDDAVTGGALYPGKTEICNDIDDNCSGAADEGCDDDNDDYCDAAMLMVGKPATCKTSTAVSGKGDDCNDDQITGPSVHPKATEVCNDVDDNCSGSTDKGCDDDKDGYCDAAMTVYGVPKICPSSSGGTQGAKGNDCNDGVTTGFNVNPGKVEICNDIDDNCSSGTDEGCDNDNDDYCDAAMPVVGQPATCPKTTAVSGKGDDCNDDATTGFGVNPGQKEVCGNGKDENCNAQVDEGCVVLNANGCPATGSGASCGGGKGTCAAGLCQYTDVQGYKWTLVPAGKFWMGCNPAVDSVCSGNSHENPQHEVDLSAYWIGVYEVTADLYKKCVTASFAGCTVPSTTTGTFATYATAGKEQHPVNHVNWGQAQAVCKWLGGDLPSEAQWEKAARGGCEVYSGKDCKSSEVKYPWGNVEPVCGTHAVYYAAPGTCGGAYTTYAVGAGSVQGASPYGAYDMAGNVWEWTMDWYDSGFYGKAAATTKDAVNTTSASSRVIRGGSFGIDAPYLRTGDRDGSDPSGASKNIGVRCSRSYP